MGSKKKKKIQKSECEGFIIRHRSPSSFLVDIRRRGMNVRQSFATLEEARTCCRQKAMLLRNQGLAAFELSERDRLDAQEALKLLDGHASLLEAARFWNMHNAARAADATFSDVADSYVENLQHLNRRPNTISSARYKYNRIARALGERYINSITRADLERWLKSQKLSPASRNNFLRYIRALFNFAVENGYSEHNPSDRMKMISVESQMPEIWKPAQVRKVMRAAEKIKPPLIPYLALGFFAGLRPSEIRGLEWGDVDLRSRIIAVRPEVAKTRRTRRVDMSANLHGWIRKYRDAIPQTVAPTSYTTLRRWRKKVMEECGIAAWPPDIMRHCFATYYLQIHDIDSTIKQLGHTSANMLYDNYRGLASDGDAKKFWAIKPKSR